MPLYEFLRLAIEKLESSKQKPSSIDPSLEIAEAPENGENTGQGQLESITGSPAHDAQPSVYGEKCGGVEYIFNGISPGDLYFTSRRNEASSDQAVHDLPNSSQEDAGKLSSLTAHSFGVSGPSGDFSKREGASRCIIDVDTFMSTAYTRGALDGDRATFSSVSSGNSADDTKIRFRGIEEPVYQSDVLLNAKKPSPAEGVCGSKRRRAAEVHNLSERRRRDRINQKLQTLQELIPNSNKADKASLLDEVIEYLKNLKHQVQMMSMASGFCVPPLMFTPGYHAPTPHCPVFSVPSIHGAHYPTPMGPINFQCADIPVRFFTRSVPGAHLVPVTGWPQAWVARPGASWAMNDEDLSMKKNSERVMNKLQATSDVANGSR